MYYANIDLREVWHCVYTYFTGEEIYCENLLFERSFKSVFSTYNSKEMIPITAMYNILINPMQLSTQYLRNFSRTRFHPLLLSNKIAQGPTTLSDKLIRVLIHLLLCFNCLLQTRDVNVRVIIRNPPGLYFRKINFKVFSL